MHAVDKVVIIDYAEMLAPAGDPTFFSSADRQSVVTLHRWSFSPAIERADSVVVLVTENLSELNAKLVSNPTTATIHVPMPDEAARRQAILATLPKIEPAWLDQLAEVTAGLKIVQIKALLSSSDTTQDDRAGVLNLVFKRKREIIERECFWLIEFVEPARLSRRGIEEAKKEPCSSPRTLSWATQPCPMGILFTGVDRQDVVAEVARQGSRAHRVKFKNSAASGWAPPRATSRRSFRSSRRSVK